MLKICLTEEGEYLKKLNYFDMSIDQSIKSHLFYDYKFSSASIFLNESNGFYDPLLKMSEEIYRIYLLSIKDSVIKTGFFNGSIVIDGKDITDSFFDKLIIRTAFVQEHVPIADIDGAYLFDRSGIFNDEYIVNISLVSHAQDDEFHDVFVCFMCHELTHAYEDYNEYKSTGQSYVRDIDPFIIDRFELSKLIPHVEENNDTDLSNLYSMIQWILREEKDTEPASFASEIMLKRKGNIIAQYSTMNDFFKDTRAYKVLMEREKILNELKNIEDKERKDKITEVFNRIYTGSHRNYDEIMNFFTKQFNNKKHRMIRVGSAALTKTVECIASDPLHFHTRR